MSGDNENKRNVYFVHKRHLKNYLFYSRNFKKSLSVLEYRRAKPIKRKSRSNYSDVQLFDEKSLSEVYHAQCYKLFTAVKIPADFKKESGTECNIVSEVSGKNSEISIPASTTTQIAETSAELSIPDSSITTVDADTPAELSIPSTSTTTQAAGISTDECEKPSIDRGEYGIKVRTNEQRWQ
ncbi:hypothetical protein HHI36_002942 [Cryptolaemus montrouzieri]|uniref:Uncharacterized protein n=1 Tax=Cryptolaemus montrouzieri TaxID=559131 RepID=A0ABD2PCX5_9CUCU